LEVAEVVVVAALAGVADFKFITAEPETPAVPRRCCVLATATTQTTRAVATANNVTNTPRFALLLLEEGTGAAGAAATFAPNKGTLSASICR